MDAEDGVAMGFGDKRFQRGVRYRVEERSRDRNLSHILFQDRHAFFWSEFDHRNGLGVAPTAERHLARDTGVAHPGHLAIGCHEPAIRACLHQGHQRRTPCDGSSDSHCQQIRVSRPQTHPKEDSYQSIEEAAPKAQAIHCSHDTPLASGSSSYIASRRRGSTSVVSHVRSTYLRCRWRGPSSVCIL
jgi:hypothetical protein